MAIETRRLFSNSHTLEGWIAGCAFTNYMLLKIVAFNLFESDEFDSEFQILEVKRHTPLTDKLCLQYYELPKLSEVDDGDDELKLWLALFNAKTEEELAKLEAMEVSVMKQAIGAYRHVTATDEFKELERLRSRARHNEASALGNARREGYREAEKELHGVIADKDAEIERLRAQLENQKS